MRDVEGIRSYTLQYLWMKYSGALFFIIKWLHKKMSETRISECGELILQKNGNYVVSGMFKLKYPTKHDKNNLYLLVMDQVKQNYG